MTSDSKPYAGKSAYHGDLVLNYERDRELEPIWGLEQAWVENWIKTLPPGARVLDLPVGTGRFTEMMAANGLYIYGADISEDMLKLAAQRCAGMSGRAVFARADVEALTYADDEFDHVISWRLFHLLPPRSSIRALSELARVCRGRLVVQFFGVEQRPWWWQSLRAVKHWMHDVLGLGPTSKGDGTPWSHIRSYPYSERFLTRLFARVGVSVVSSYRLGEYGGASVYVYVLEKHGGLR